MLLQQLLRSIGSSDTRHSAAITYSVLSLLIRLVSIQSSVFNLWFSRRCYERSRGEMITMLYEKTLSRKVIGNSTQPQEVVNPGGINRGGPPIEAKRPRFQIEFLLESLFGTTKRLFSTTNENQSTKPASRGKILNMMRHASLAFFLFVLQLTLRQ